MNERKKKVQRTGNGVGCADGGSGEGALRQESSWLLWEQCRIFYAQEPRDHHTMNSLVLFPSEKPENLHLLSLYYVIVNVLMVSKYDSNQKHHLETYKKCKFSSSTANRLNHESWGYCFVLVSLFFCQFHRNDEVLLTFTSSNPWDYYK